MTEHPEWPDVSPKHIAKAELSAEAGVSRTAANNREFLCQMSVSASQSYLETHREYLAMQEEHTDAIIGAEKLLAKAAKSLSREVVKERVASTAAIFGPGAGEMPGVVKQWCNDQARTIATDHLATPGAG